MQEEYDANQKAAADAQAAQAEAERQAAQQAAAQAENAKRQAEAEAERTRLQAQAEADAARQAALAQQQQAQAQIEQARQAALQAEQEKAQLRDQLRQQLNVILETRETARGLIVNMSDVLFDTGKYTLKPGAREKLAKISGILLAHPGLKIEVDGHTDNVGSDDFNQRLSEERANSVRDYLVSQNVPSDAVTAMGFGKTRPVSDNDTAAGRQQNRRVELVVSGDAIGATAAQGNSPNE
jgi:outer membrane protein OmpA-like peptidoglycan-associated protein